MDNANLTNFYDSLKSELHRNDKPEISSIRIGKGFGMDNPGALRFKKIAARECDKLKENCRKHIILDIYCNILPLDDDYKCGHMGQMNHDVDCMLANKGMTATQYLTSAYEKTKAPLVEYVLRATDMIGNQFMEEAEKTLKDAQQKGIDAPEPKAPTEDDKEIENQLVDVKQDNEYNSFIDKLKEKTINKIVADVSKIISNKKEEEKMTFDPKPTTNELSMESTVSIGLDYLQSKLYTESGSNISPELEEEMIGMAIRESALNQIDTVFRQDNYDIKSFASNIKYGKGVIINESAINELRK